MNRRIASIAPLLFVGACVGGPQMGELASDPALDTQRTSALLVVERRATIPSTSSPHTAQVGARFVQFTGVARGALPELLGTPAIPEAVGCRQQEPRESDQSSRAEVRLLDVGALEVRSGAHTLALEPRRLPDLFRVVSGVVYAAEGDIEGSRWQFHTAGNSTARIPAFDVEAQAPEALSGLAVDEHAITADNAVVRLPRGAFSLRWRRGDAADFVVAHFEGGATDHSVPVICSARDDAGALEIDAAWSDRITRTAALGRLVVHRVRVRPFTIANVDNAAVVFDSAVTLRLGE